MGHKKESSRPVGLWVIAGVVIFILLLLLWLTIADLFGSTDIG